MARDKATLQDDALRPFGLDTGQNSKIDGELDDSFNEILRVMSDHQFEWARERGEVLNLDQDQAVYTLDPSIGPIDNQSFKIQKGSRPFSRMNYLNPADFDRFILRPDQTGRPTRVTSEPYTETRVLRVHPVPNDSDFSITFSYFRNLNVLLSGDFINAPEDFEELVIRGMQLRIAININSPDVPLYDQLFLQKRKHLWMLFPTADQEKHVVPPPEVMEFDEDDGGLMHF